MQILFQIPLNEAALLIRDSKVKLGFLLLRLRAVFPAITHAHAGGIIARCRKVSNDQFFHPLYLLMV